MRSFLAVLLVTAACGPDVTGVAGETDDGSTSDAGTTTVSGTGTSTSSSATGEDTGSDSGSEGSGTETEGELPPPSSDWCDRVTGGAAGGEALVDLAVAHAWIRYFGTEADYPSTDAALGGAMAGAEPDLDAYDDALDAVCVVGAEGGALGPASVELRGSTAWVRPGTGPVTLPEGADAVVLDLRDLPNVPGLEDRLAAAVSPALATAITRPTRRVRRHNGLVDQYFSASNVYTTGVDEVTAPAIEPTGDADLPLTIVTGRTMPPAAAELAGSLRLQQRAWLVGHDVFASVAESRWSPIGRDGAIWRGHDLLEWGTSRWPDLILADVMTDDADDVDLPPGEVEPPVFEGDERAIVTPYSPFDDEYGDTLGMGEIRAGLMVAYGAAELFFTYFDVVGHDTDEALLELLAEVADGDADDRDLMDSRVRRLASALRDGHAFVFDLFTAGSSGAIAARIEALDGYPVVRRTSHPDLLPGDTIIEIAGDDALDWYDARYPLVSAASDGYRHDLVTRMLTYRDDAIDVRLRAPDGSERDATLDPQPASENAALGFAPVNRDNGWLDDLGSPTIYYVNMAGAAAVGPAIDDAIDGGATGMVVDMRGYPTGNHYTVAQQLIPGAFVSPTFQVPTYVGPDAYTEEETVSSFNPSPAFEGPLVLLVGNHCVSAAENFSIMLVGADRVTVVGQQSASTNGNITGISLPGGWVMSMTGMRVLYPDGSTFHGVGIVPDIEVAIDPQAYADGDDPELLAAIAEIET